MLPQMKDIFRLLFLSSWGYVDWKENTVGIYGLDLMIDTDYKMWLIEVNKSPCMAYSTEVTASLIPRFMEDMAKVIVDKGSNTGDLELLLETPFIEEPKEERNAEEFTIRGQKIVNPKAKGKSPKKNKH